MVATKKLRLKIWHDVDVENPFTAWDCEPEVMVDSGRSNFNDYSDGKIENFIKNRLTFEVVKPEINNLAEIVEEYLEDYEDYTEEELASYLVYNINFSDIEQVTKVLELFELPHLNYTSTGYSQGDWANVLIVATDEFFERTGANRDRMEVILDGSKNLFDAWAWGDVFGFTVEEGTPVEVVNRETKEVVREEIDWEFKDSCGGFYGRDFENNGMLDYLPEELEEELKDFDK
jgi:hypothetical protein